MAFDDTKVENGGTTAEGRLPASEWNDMVIDQKARLPLSGGTMIGSIVMQGADILLSGANINLSGNDIHNINTATFNSAGEFDNGSGVNGSGAITIDWNNGNMQLIRADENITFSYTDPTNGGGRFDLRIIQSGGNTLTFPGSQFWPGGTAPVLTTTAEAYDIITVRYRGVGNYDGTFGQDFK